MLQCPCLVRSRALAAFLGTAFPPDSARRRGMSDFADAVRPTLPLDPSLKAHRPLREWYSSHAMIFMYLWRKFSLFFSYNRMAQNEVHYTSVPQIRNKNGSRVPVSCTAVSLRPIKSHLPGGHLENEYILSWGLSASVLWPQHFCHEAGLSWSLNTVVL